jgi:hypothetical protein
MNRVMLAAAATIVTLVATGVARAENTCKGEIAQTKTEWQGLAMQPTPKPAQVAKGVKGHEHIQSAVDSMRFHMAQATSLCSQGKDHEALLHLDVVRAFLHLPEVQHPADHRYLFKTG